MYLMPSKIKDDMELSYKYKTDKELYGIRFGRREIDNISTIWSIDGNYDSKLVKQVFNVNAHHRIAVRSIVVDINKIDLLIYCEYQHINSNNELSFNTERRIRSLDSKLDKKKRLTDKYVIDTAVDVFSKITMEDLYAYF